jgi:hypothetical protein
MWPSKGDLRYHSDVERVRILEVSDRGRRYGPGENCRFMRLAQMTGLGAASAQFVALSSRAPAGEGSAEAVAGIHYHNGDL